jgi:hypothetical protein
VIATDGAVVKRDLGTAALYLVAFVPVAILSILVSYASIGFASAVLPRFGPVWVGVVLNLLPQVATGGVVYAAIAGLRRPSRGVASRHIVRAAPLYVIGLALAVLVALGWRDPGFGLVAQLFVWPLAAVIGGIVADAVVAGRQRHHGDTEVTETSSATSVSP